MSKIKIDKFFKRLKGCLKERESVLRCFSQYEFQSEGWLKGECIALLDDMKNKHQILNFDREFSFGKKKIDLTITDLSNGLHYLELKHWYIGKQKGHIWDTKSQITGLEDEFEKFKKTSAETWAWVIVLCSFGFNPEDFKMNAKENWEDGIKQFNKEYAPWRLEQHKDSEFLFPFCFLGILHAKGLKFILKNPLLLSNSSPKIKL